MADILNIDSLTCGYDTREVLREISFSVKKGDFLGIVGPNGAGKTTLFRAITRILKPWGGKIFYCGKDINLISRGELAKEVAVLPQSLEIIFSFSVEQFVSMGRFARTGRLQTLKRNDLDVIENVLALTEVSTLRERRISELSGGERQRAILAQSFAQEPRLLLLDEPTAHLDIGHQVQILDLIKKLNREEKLTVIMVMHDVNLAGEYCDRLILLNDGMIFKDGTPQEVLTYQAIEEVYKTVVVVDKNPVTKKPRIFLVPGDKRETG